MSTCPLWQLKDTEEHDTSDLATLTATVGSKSERVNCSLVVVVDDVKIR